MQNDFTRFTRQKARHLVFLWLLIVAVTPGYPQEIIAWGSNSDGQTDVPAGLTGVIAVYAGSHHTVALKADGTLVAWGSNNFGQTSVPAGLTGVVDVAAGGDHTVALKADGTVVVWGSDTRGQTSVPTGLSGVTAIDGSSDHTVALKADGTVVAWGWNNFGQTDAPAGLTGVAAVSAGYAHTVALKADGTVVAWGDNAQGQTSVPAGLSGVIAIATGVEYTVALKADGTVVAWGRNNDGQTTVPVGLTGVVAIAGGIAHTVALKADGTAVAWGWNKDGQAEVPAGLNGAVAIAAGYFHAVALKADSRKVLAWGFNNFGQTNVPTQSTGVTVKALAAGYYHTVALKADGTVVAWEGDNFGQTDVPAGLTGVTAVEGGTFYTVVRKADGTVVAWGNNDVGQTDAPAGLTGVAAIAVGYRHAVALKADGTAVAWGDNEFGQATVPAGLNGIIALAAGNEHTVALKADGTVVAWGSDIFGQATVPTELSGVIALAAGGLHTVALKADGTVVAWGRNNEGQTSVPAGLSGVTAIATGYAYTMALKADGTVVTWGDNAYGQTSVPAGLSGVTAIAAGPLHAGVVVFNQKPQLTQTSFPAAYQEEASPVGLNTAFIVSDDENEMTSATVRISAGFLKGDLLGVAATTGIVSTYDDAAGVLTLTGKASKADYQTVLQSLTFTSQSPSPASNPSRTIAVTVSDGYVSSVAEAITIAIVAVNDAPSFAKGADVVVNQGNGPQTIPGWAKAISAGPADEAGQVLAFLVTSDNAGLFSAQPAIDASGTLTFTPGANAVGTAALMVVLTDNGGTANGGVDQSAIQTFIIVVTPVAPVPVNDAPSFAKGADVVVNQDAGAQTIPGWATAISAGPVDEAAQTLVFLVTSDNAGLFGAQPAIDANGTLTFTPAANATGTAAVTVVLTDNGGTANGGVDQSAAQTFAVTVAPVVPTPVNDAPYVNTPPDVNLPVNSAAQTVTLTGITPGPNESNQSLAFSAASDNASLVHNLTIAHIPGSNTASLIFALVPGQAGTATITVRLRDNGGTANGGVDEYTVTFRVTVEAVTASMTLFVPTLFSPDADNTNDLFRVRGTGIAAIQLRIFSRIGVEVFRTQDVGMATQSGWDGRYAGQPMPAGVYTWTVSGRFADGTSLSFRDKNYGQVTLVR